MNEESVFTNALARTDPAERRAYLDEACGADNALRREVEALLATHEADSGFLQRPAAEQMAAAGTTNAATEALTPAGRDSPGHAHAATTDTAGGAQQSDDDLAFLAAPAESGHLGRLGHYEVHSVIGKGGFGIVLKAFDQRLHRMVAIKVLAPALAANGAARKRFIREARAAAAVKNEHVVGIYEVQEEAQPPYLVMEYIEGVSLEDKLDRHGPLGIMAILRIGMQIAEGLAAAHKQGLVHRDIKPANILLENGVERVKITDFGLARAVDDASVTQSGTIAGTPMYMSPEQAEGLAIDHRSDLFSLGTVLYAMCTGHPPFRATGTMAVLKRVVEETPRPIREVNAEIPEWLCTIIGQLHAKKPEARFQSAQEVAALLETHLAHVQQPDKVPLPSPAVPSTTADAAPRRVRSPSASTAGARIMRWSLSLIAAGILIGVTLLTLAWFRDALIVFDVQPGVEVTLTNVRDGAVQGIANSEASGEVNVVAGQYRVQLRCDAAQTIESVAITEWGHTTTYSRGADMDDIRLKLGRGDRVTMVVKTSRRPAAKPIAGNWESNWGAVALEHGTLDRKQEVAVSGFYFQEPDKKGTITKGTYDVLKGTLRISFAEPWWNGTGSAEFHLSPDGNRLDGTWNNDADESGIWTMIRRPDDGTRPPPVGEPGWVPLFNRKDLTAWHVSDKHPGLWKVADGILTGRLGNDQRWIRTVLVSDRNDLVNFHARIEMKLNKGSARVALHAPPPS